jgi:hypothetical protein
MINYILLTVAVFNIILSIIIIILSSVRKKKSDGSSYLERNYGGIYSGLIIMIFSFCFLLLMLLGKIEIGDYNNIAFWGIGGMFFVCGIVIIIGFININQVELFDGGSIPSGICEKDGIYGTLMSNGVCVIPAERLENCKEKAVEAYKTQIASRKVKKCKSDRLSAKEDFKEVSRGDIDGNKVKSKVVNKELGICQFKNKFGSNEFGYMHPYFGKKCMTAEQLTTLLNKYPDQKKIHNVKGNIYYHPYQSTKCLGYPKTDLVSYDLMCKENFGNDYGVRKIDGENCPQNDYRA